jgi:hypothetical protein
VKKLLQILSASVVGASMMVGVAGATSDATTCSISNTGAESTNVCKSTDNTVIVANCDNSFFVDSGNRQIVTTGTANSSVNNSAGNVTTGSAVNTNGTTVTLGASCNTATQAPVVVAITPTTPAAGQGAGASTPAASPAPVAAKVASLPETGSNTVLNDTLAGVAVLGGTMAVSQLGIVAYRRFALK